MAASSSSTTSYSSKWTYDVFLSFRGEDTRKTFVDHLLSALKDKAIYTFKDDEKLRKGQSISPALHKAIEESRFSIVVLSERYASSSWCLDELVKIVECKKMLGQTVIPVFYNVNPSDLRKQPLENQKRKEALTEVANISGLVIQNTADGHESQCIKEIVGDILSELGRETLTIMDNLIGIESRVQKVKSLLHTELLDDVRIIGIWGMPGMGKTTVARAVFEDVSNQFEARSFVPNVREVSKSRGLKHVQEKVLSDILMEKELRIRSVDEGISMMRKRLFHKRVFIVMDDVDHVDQLDALGRMHEWFGKGSRVIITTRDMGVLRKDKVNERHKVDLLNDGEALKLFSRHAFDKDTPLEEYVGLSHEVVHYAGGLPLALKVLGSFLNDKKMMEWRSALDRLEVIPQQDILDILKISYDGLTDIGKKLFLDVACFFLRMNKHDVTPILASFDFFPDIGLRVLIEKSLITTSGKDETLEMHDLIQEMAWYIVRQEDPKEAGRRSRLWLYDDIHHVLTNNTGTEAIKGIKLKLIPYMTDSTAINFPVGAFWKMKKLRFLWVDDYSLRPKYIFPFFRLPVYLPEELRWLDWQGFPSKSLPTFYEPKKLVGLILINSNIVELWRGKKILDKIKIVDLCFSKQLMRTPDFSGAPNLEQLLLSGCEKLEEVHPSVGDLSRLVILDLGGCRRVKSVQLTGNMTSLKSFIFSGYSKQFPQILTNMKSLIQIRLDGSEIEEIPSSIGKLSNLLILELRDSKRLRCLPSTLCSLKSLKRLDLSGCSQLVELPENLGNMERLKELCLAHTAIKELPSSIGKLSSLKYMQLSRCKKLEELPEHLGNLETLKELYMDGTAIEELPSSIGNLSSLLWLDLSNCKNLRCLPSTTCRLKCLQRLDLSGCSKLGELPENMGNIESLEELLLNGTAITQPPSFIGLHKNLKKLKLTESQE